MISVDAMDVYLSCLLYPNRSRALFYSMKLSRTLLWYMDIFEVCTNLILGHNSKKEIIDKFYIMNARFLT